MRSKISHNFFVFPLVPQSWPSHTSLFPFRKLVPINLQVKVRFGRCTPDRATPPPQPLNKKKQRATSNKTHPTRLGRPVGHYKLVLFIEHVQLVGGKITISNRYKANRKRGLVNTSQPTYLGSSQKNGENWSKYDCCRWTRILPIPIVDAALRRILRYAGDQGRGVTVSVPLFVLAALLRCIVDLTCSWSVQPHKSTVFRSGVDQGQGWGPRHLSLDDPQLCLTSVWLSKIRVNTAYTFTVAEINKIRLNNTSVVG